MRATYLGLIWIFAAAAIGQPATAPAVPTSAQVESWLAQLSSDDGPQRQHAQDRLVESGARSPDIEPRLRKLLRETQDEEAAARARSALRLIAENRLTGPTTIALRLDQAEASEAFAQLSRQLGHDVSPDPPELWRNKSWPRVTLSADGLPFWEAFRNICRQVGVEPDFSDNGRFKFVSSDDGKWAKTPSLVVGPLLVQAVRITRTRTIEFADPAAAEQVCQLTISAYVEPKVRLLAEGSRMAIDSIVDEQGHSLLSDDADDPAFNTIANNTRAWESEIDLSLPPHVGHKIARLKGTIHLQVPERIQSLEVQDILAVNESVRTISGRRVLIHQAAKVQGGYEVRVTLFRDQLSEEDWRRWQTPSELVRLVDAKGLPILFNGVTDNEGDEKQLHLKLQFENPNNLPNGGPGPVGPPVKLIWDVPLERREILVPFEFRDLPLP